MHSIQWDAYQAWRSGAKQILFVGGRRLGKTEHGSHRFLTGAHEARLAGREELRYLIAPTYKLCRPAWRKIHRLAPPGWITKSYGSVYRPEAIRFGPKSTIEFHTADNPRLVVGEGLADAWVEEGGMVPDAMVDESLLPMLIDHDAPVLYTGTPKGKNWFYHRYLRGLDPLDKSVLLFGGTTYQNPFLTMAAIERLIHEILQKEGGHLLIRQEIFAQFIEAVGKVFAAVNWQRIMGGQISPPIVGREYLAGVDTARKHDFTVVVIIDAMIGQVVAVDRFNKIPYGGPNGQEQRIARLVNAYGARAAIDATGQGGDRIFEELEKLISVCEPVNFSASKVPLVQNLIFEAEGARIRIPKACSQLVLEMKAFDYEVGRTGRIKYAAPSGWHDDCVCALALACWGRRGYHSAEVESIPPGGGYGLGAQIAPPVALSTFQRQSPDVDFADVDPRNFRS